MSIVSPAICHTFGCGLCVHNSQGFQQVVSKLGTLVVAIIRVATVREKYLENEIFFQVREKSGNFVDGQGNLERIWKVREKSRNLKINGYGRQSSENLFILCKRGKEVLPHEIV